ncbi:uncharacterized conserved protein [Slackia heliotrinireducens DSM 20476]|uniref:Uncharacterized conserved protein n=1 Tax=Slackia heliotrinireducens (strain ATCC 29202 / DSM 20476 / NCTC 11029 / RHS 1) TaxID=471855 RepID=C7N4V2_SLAHD|nr:uncharacterized conserved protein [Slackia heliotrinireducens DSM 20476]
MRMPDRIPPSTLELPYPSMSEGRRVSISFYTDEALFEACGVRMAFTERFGGVSEGPYESLDLGTAAAGLCDAPERTAENRSVAARALGAQGMPLIVPNQVHKDTVVVCGDISEVSDVQKAADGGADAVVVTCSGVAAMLRFADCVPVVVVSPTGAFAVVHAGWRGVVARIVEKAICSLAEKDGASVFSYNAYIGPHIRPCCFQVGEDVALTFSREFGAEVVGDDRHVDMVAALTQSMTRVGMNPDRIADLGVCTVEDERFFSYRRSGGDCGRHGAMAFRI